MAKAEAKMASESDEAGMRRQVADDEEALTAFSM